MRAAVYYERGELQEAAKHVDQAAQLYASQGLERRCMKAVLLRGQIAYESLAFAKSAAVMQQVMEFGEKIGDASWVARGDAALASVDMSEALLVLERWPEIAKVAAHAFRALKKAGHLTGALTALAYLKEAATKRQLTPGTLKTVREYLRRVEREPDLLFVPPPSSPR